MKIFKHEKTQAVYHYKEKHQKILKNFWVWLGGGRQLFEDFHFWLGVLDPNPL